VPPVDILDTVRRQMNDVAVGVCRPCIYKAQRFYLKTAEEGLADLIKYIYY